jgi:hypothetical protein
MIPDADRISLLDALGIFDRELRGVQEWQDWTSNLSHKFAIFNNFQIYPVKKIISLATNLPVSEFSGGDQSNAYVTSRGLKVISLRAFSWTIENGSVAAKIRPVAVLGG